MLGGRFPFPSVGIAMSKTVFLSLLVSGLLFGGERGQAPCQECHLKALQVHSSVHADLACTECHFNITESPHPTPLPTHKMCISCHKEAFAALADGVHLDLTCTDCHGSGHDIPVPALFQTGNSQNLRRVPRG